MIIFTQNTRGVTINIIIKTLIVLDLNANFGLSFILVETFNTFFAMRFTGLRFAVTNVSRNTLTTIGPKAVSAQQTNVSIFVDQAIAYHIAIFDALSFIPIKSRLANLAHLFGLKMVTVLNAIGVGNANIIIEEITR